MVAFNLANPASRQWLLFLAVFATACLLLAGGYYWFLRADYALFASDLRPEQAATIVDQLKKDNVRYELRDGGTTILVPADEADAERLQLAGQDLPAKGTVGFELFNQSDMGLTDFAQKVNYQRALQGEIARTIMSMDGIAYARVHLALPERSLFRASSSEPRAAVTLTPARGAEMDAGRIAGIQRLVAAAVPDLALDQVAVLDERGELLTPEFSDVPGARGESAIADNYRSRVMTAVHAAAPRAHVEAKVILLPRTGVQDSAIGPAGAPDGEVREHGLRVVLFERLPLGAADRQAVTKAVEGELNLDEARGDQLSFSPAPEVSAPMPTATAPQRADAVQDKASAGNADQLMARIARGWTIALTILGAGALFLAGRSMRRRRIRRRQELAERIRGHLLLTQGAPDVA